MDERVLEGVLYGVGAGIVVWRIVMGAVSEWTSYQNARLKSKGLGTKKFFGAAFVPTHIFWERCIGIQEGSVPGKVRFVWARVRWEVVRA